MVRTLKISYDINLTRETWCWEEGHPCIRCPNNHASVMKNHKVDPDGLVKGSVQCPLCEWHVFVKLGGYMGFDPTPPADMPDRIGQKVQISQEPRVVYEIIAWDPGRSQWMTKLIEPDGGDTIGHFREDFLAMLEKEGKGNIS